MNTDFLLHRRAFLMTGAAAFALGAVPAARAAGSVEGARRIAFLQALIYRLYPHPGVNPAIYEDWSRRFAARADTDPVFGEGFTATRAALDRAAGGDWLTAGREAQIAAMKEIEDTPFFAVMRDSAQNALYNDSRVYRTLGFEGSSLEYGGYINRGFNDIDWLPED